MQLGKDNPKVKHRLRLPGVCGKGPGVLVDSKLRVGELHHHCFVMI